MHSSTTYLLFAALLSVRCNVLALPMGASSVGLQNRNYNPTLETRADNDLSQADVSFRHHKKTTDASKKITPVAKAGIAAKQVVNKVKEVAHTVHDKIVKRDLEFEARDFDLEFETRDFEYETRADNDLSQADVSFRHHKKTTDASKKITPVAKAGIAAKQVVNKVKEVAHTVHDKIVKRDFEFEARDFDLEFEARDLEYETRADNDLSQADVSFRHHKKTTDASKKITPVAKAGIAAKQVVNKVKEVAHTVHDKIVKRDLEFEARDFDLEFEARDLEYETRADNDLSQADVSFRHHKKTTDASKKITPVAKAGIAVKHVAGKVKALVTGNKKRDLDIWV
ncbi:hypothetical protein B0H34DRAFT_671545 [Crassisporium funariophilum]|nr:hypothetical protein B0H34DRAFT_671545 [Crassisporium funariophilum]